MRTARQRSATQQEYRRLHFFDVLYRGFYVEECCDIVEISHATLYRWVALFNEYGIDGLTLKPESGRNPAIDSDLGTVILSALKNPKEHGAFFWTGIKLHGYLKRTHKVEFCYATLLRFPKSNKVKRMVLRKIPHKQDPERRREFVEELRNRASQENTTLSFLDECGFEGDPKPRKQWIPPGEEPL